jgi:DHA1 family inner membrane transport protein
MRAPSLGTHFLRRLIRGHSEGGAVWAQGLSCRYPSSGRFGTVPRQVGTGCRPRLTFAAGSGTITGGNSQMPIALFALALTAFAVGTTELVIVGLLPSMAQDLSVTIPTAGLLVTGYALGVACLGPGLTALTQRLPRRTTLIALATMFALGHVAMALAPNFGLLVVIRLLTASAHGAFFGLGAVVAASIVPAHKRTQAISIMITGLTVAALIGVPGGTFIGQHVGWRVVFLIVALIAATSAGALWFTLPRGTAMALDAAVSGGVRRGPLALALTITVLGYGAIFVPLTYLSPYLTDITGLSLNTVTVLLIVFGGSCVAGSLLGGRAGDRWPIKGLPFTLTAIAGILVIAWAGGGIAWMVGLLLVGWGGGGLALVPLMQSRVVALAGGGPVASTLNIAAFNVGIAGGAAVGGLFVRSGLLGLLPLVGAVLAAVSAALTIISNQHVRSLARPNGDVSLPDRALAAI